MNFYQEDHWFQYLTAMILFLSAFLFMLRRDSSYSIRVLSSFGLLWLGLDEIMMFHECMKTGGPLTGLHSYHFRDASPLIYLLTGSIGLICLRKSLIRNNSDKKIIFGIIFFSIITVAGDTFGILPKKYDVEIEEIAELLVSLFILVLAYQNLNKYTTKKEVLIGIAVCALILLILSLPFYYTRSYICPRLFS